MKKHLDLWRKLFSPADKKKFMAIVMLMAIAGIMEMAGVGLLAGVITLFLAPEGEFQDMIYQKFCSFFPGISHGNFIVCAVIAVVLLMIFKNLFSLLIIALQTRFLRRRQSTITCRLLNTYINADYRHYIMNSADQYNGAVERLKRLFDNFFQPALQLLADAIVIFGLMLIALLMLPGTAIITMATVLGAAWLINKAFQKLNKRLGDKQYHQDVKENKLRLNVLLGMEQIKISGTGEYFSNRLRELNSDICRRSGTLYILGQIPRLSLESVALILLCVIFVILIVSGRTPQDILLVFTVIAASMARMLPALSRAHYNLTQLKQYGVLLEELTGNLTSIPAELNSANADAPDFDGDIVIENLNFAYTPELPVISNLNCTFKYREITGIAGRSGIGKTTLLNLITGLFNPASGKISANGNDISGNALLWRKQIGFVPQNVFIFDGTLRENIALGIPENEIDDQKISSVLKCAQLPEFADDPAMQLNSNSGLSGGQRQRIGIARALYRDPGVLILDEATSALDGKTESGILELLDSLRGKKTVIVISHRKETLDICDTLIDLQQNAG